MSGIGEKGMLNDHFTVEGPKRPSKNPEGHPLDLTTLPNRTHEKHEEPREVG